MTDDQSPEPGPSPAEALAAIASSRKTVHDRVAVGGWRYDLSYSAIMAAMVGGQLFGNPLNITASSLGVLAFAVLFQHESRRTGLRISGVSPKHARWVAIALGLVAAALIIGMSIVRRRLPEVDVRMLAAATASAAFVAALIGSRIWRRVYRAEMGVGK